jgi:hypothetical protein
MNEANYASFEASKRLVDAGIVLETDFWWIRERSAWKLADNDYGLPRAFAIPAPCMAEVWRELPDGTDMTKGTFAGKNPSGITEAWCCLRRGEGAVTSPDIQRANPTDALIDLMIWVRKEARDE